MANKVDPSAGERRGLLGLGTTRRWDVALDETLNGDSWSLEIDGPQAYLVFQLNEPSVLSAMVDYLQSPSGGPENGLVLGRFGASSVSLIWDDEESPRCFLIVGPESGATLRLTFDGDDVRMLVEALHQLVADLPNPPTSETNGPPVCPRMS
jgi:hypothetical protein